MTIENENIWAKNEANSNEHQYRRMNGIFREITLHQIYGSHFIGREQMPKRRNDRAAKIDNKFWIQTYSVTTALRSQLFRENTKYAVTFSISLSIIYHPCIKQIQ